MVYEEFAKMKAVPLYGEDLDPQKLVHSILSGPPINWKAYYQKWKRSEEDLKTEQTKVENLAASLYWEKPFLIPSPVCKNKQSTNKHARRKACEIPFKFQPPTRMHMVLAKGVLTRCVQARMVHKTGLQQQTMDPSGTPLPTRQCREKHKTVYAEIIVATNELNHSANQGCLVTLPLISVNLLQIFIKGVDSNMVGLMVAISASKMIRKSVPFPTRIQKLFSLRCQFDNLDTLKMQKCMEERFKEMMARKGLEVVQSKIEGWKWECTFYLRSLLNPTSLRSQILNMTDATFK
ncbi:hypothetical protein CTI12_AA294940 [Artemisia annua]|uniref:Uncharacterized protein n=1 Tax=Artemisia annua TaxID=35608 RepID=A0A2U1N8G0_ARTAN|nr:hypothetical protein CTI12_AA294940 [Artemisia annua]